MYMAVEGQNLWVQTNMHNFFFLKTNMHHFVLFRIDLFENKGQITSFADNVKWWKQQNFMPNLFSWSKNKVIWFNLQILLVRVNSFQKDASTVFYFKIFSIVIDTILWQMAIHISCVCFKIMIMLHFTSTNFIKNLRFKKENSTCATLLW